MKKSLCFVFAAVLAASLGFSCKAKSAAPVGDAPISQTSAPLPPVELLNVTFLPYWVANAQFAGYYMAKETGIYEKYGMNVEIIPYEPFYTSSQMIQRGTIDFAASWLLNAVEMKATGVDIVNIAQFSTRSSLMLLTKKSSGIDTLEKMNGRKAGIWAGYELQPRALFKKHNLNVEIVPIGSTNNLFLRDGVQITNANWFDEYHSIINAGYNPDELNIFFFADYGFNFLEDGIYCLAEKRRLDPKLCEDFVNATQEGWLQAYADPEKAVDIVIAYAKKMNLPANRVHQRWMLDRYRDLYTPKGEMTITLPEKDYLFAAGVLLESGQISAVPPYRSFVDPVVLKVKKDD